MMISVGEATNRITAALSQTGKEMVGLGEALGRVLARDVFASVNQPPAAVSAMDGYALIASDINNVPADLSVIGEAPAGGLFEGKVCSGQAVRIFTGGVLPEGTDCVVMQENTEKTEEGKIRILKSAPRGKNVRPGGLDFKKGDLGLKAGTVLTYRHIGLAAAMNAPRLEVYKRPRVAVLSTGSELVEPGVEPGPGMIIASNGIALCGFITQCGGEAVDLGIVVDDEDLLRAKAREARDCDFLVTSGGASVGDHDLIQKALAKDGLKVDFWKVAQRPGKPLIFGHLGQTPLLGLPGNPVSALVCAVLYLKPAIAALSGALKEEWAARRVRVRLGSALPANDQREDFMRAELAYRADGSLWATPFDAQDSAMMALLSRAKALIVRPPQAPPAGQGDEVEAILL